MRKRTILILAAIAVVALISIGCDGLLGDPPLTDSRRAAAFIDDANADPRDPLDLQRHFHPTQVSEYTSMNQERYWNDLTFFSFVDRPFIVGELTPGDAVSGHPDTTSLVGTVRSESEPDDVPIAFGFLPDPVNPENRLIRVIIVEELELIQSIR
ncbi:MAG: hypothetical protein ACOC2N_07660 [Spirochaetota bacterium]